MNFKIIFILLITAALHSFASSDEIKYLHSHECKYDSDKFLPQWQVKGDLTVSSSIEISPANGAGNVGGYVLIGKKITVPAEIADCRVYLKYKTSLIEPEWRGLKGHLGVVFMTEKSWNKLGETPEQAPVFNFYNDPAWIYHDKVDHFNGSPTEFVETQTPNFAKPVISTAALRDLKNIKDFEGHQIYFAIIWGTNYSTTDDFMSVKDVEIKFKNSMQVQEEFLNSFSQYVSGLSEFRSAVKNNDYETAKKKLAGYFRSRDKLEYIDLDVSKEDIKHADDALKGIFYAPATGVAPLEIEREKLWYAKPENQEQWAVSFNRHELWKNLAYAYSQSGDKKYLNEFSWQLRSWSQTMPVTFGRFFTEGFYDQFGFLPLSLNAGLRTGSYWYYAFDKFKDDINDDDIYTMLYWFREHGRFLNSPSNFNPVSNWGAMETNGLMHIAIMFPEFVQSNLWFQTACDRIEKMLRMQVYPDGVQKELTPSYHKHTINQFVSSLKLAKKNNIELKPSVEKMIEKMYMALAKLAMPNLTTPPLNDSVGVGSDVFATAAELYPDNQTFKYFNTNRKEGNPGFLSCRLPWAGWNIMRQGWEIDSKYLFFDTGPLGLAHYHQDKLHFIIYAYGSPLVSEIGHYYYDQSKWRNYSLQGWSHNTVVVDGMAQKREHTKQTIETYDQNDTGKWISNDKFDYASGWLVNGYADDDKKLDIIVKREIVFVKPEYFIVVDSYQSSDEKEHNYQALFHFYDNLAAAGANNSINVRSHKAGLDVYGLWPKDAEVKVVKGQQNPLLGWKKTSTIGKLVPTPVGVYQFSGRDRINAVWLFVPKTVGFRPSIRDINVNETSDEIILKWKTDSNSDQLTIYKTGDLLKNHLDFTRQTQENTLQLKFVD